MDNSVLTEETAGQISKIMVSADRYDQPGCSWHTWGDPRPQGGPPQPLEIKTQRRTSCGQKPHKHNSMGSTPPLLDP